MKHVELLLHLFLREHVVLHAALEYFGCLATLLRDEAGISLLVKVRVGKCLNIGKNVSGWILSPLRLPSDIIERHATYIAPVNLGVHVVLKLEEGFAQDVILVVKHFYFTILELVC